MKKWIALLLVAALCLSLGACGRSNKEISGGYEQAEFSVETSQQDVPNETTPSITWEDELAGYWVADDGVLFHPTVSGDYFNFCDPVSLLMSTPTNFVTEGNTLFLPYSDGATVVYEATPSGGCLRLKYLSEESNVSEDVLWQRTLCNNFTVFPESSKQTVELTVENWQDYLEFRPTCSETHNNFDELEDVFPKSWSVFAKKDASQIIVGVEDAAFEYRLAGGYYRWFTYDLATKEVTVGEPAEMEGAERYTFEDTIDDRPFYYDDCSRGCDVASLKGHYVHGVEPIWTDDTYTFVGVDYETKEITRIKGTLTVIG